MVEIWERSGENRLSYAASHIFWHLPALLLPQRCHTRSLLLFYFNDPLLFNLCTYCLLYIGDFFRIHFIFYIAVLIFNVIFYHTIEECSVLTDVHVWERDNNLQVQSESYIWNSLIKLKTYFFKTKNHKFSFAMKWQFICLPD